AHKIPIGNISKKNIYSRDENIWHISHEGGILEDPWNRPEEAMYLKTKSPKDAPDKETELELDFEKGFPKAINGKQMNPVEILEYLNKIGGQNGIGRADIVETRVVGMKSRGVYETPAGTILHTALRELEMLTMDADSLSLKRQLASRYAELIYAGKWYTVARESIDAFMAKASEYLTGTVRIALYKGNIIILGRKSPFSLYLEDLASFGKSSYDHTDATGFINLFGLSTGVAALVHRKIESDKGQAPEIQGTAATYHEK
ncbi:MAG TPA: argininosuccinate synthase, partial [Spirochaetia bacterium]|nr:argininosuccinate synthase [Spirochaetia bacterium]